MKRRGQAWKRLGLLVLCLLMIGSAYGQTPPPKSAKGPPGKEQSAKAAPSKPKELVAVLGFDRVNVSKSQIVAVANQLRTELLKSGKLTIVDRGKMDALLKEQAFQQASCTSQDCAVQAGKMLGVRKVVTGTLTKADEGLWQIAIQMIDVESSEVLLAETLNHDGDYRSLLVGGVQKIAARLLAPPGAPGEALGPGIKLAVFPCYFKINRPEPPNWQHETLQKGIDAVRKKVPVTVELTFYPQFVPGKPILDTSGLESGSWSMFGNPNEKFIAGKAAQWGMDAVLVVKTEVNADKLLVKAYVIDAKTQRMVDQEETVSTRRGGGVAMTRVIGAALLKYQALTEKR